MPDQNKDDKNDWLRITLKVIGIAVVVVLALIVVGFGLLVGICRFGGRC